MFINRVPAISVQHLLRVLFSQVPLENVKRFEPYKNHFVRGIPSRSGIFNMLHSEIQHKSTEMTAALAQADRVDDPDDIPMVVLLGVSGAGNEFDQNLVIPSGLLSLDLGLNYTRPLPLLSTSLLQLTVHERSLTL